jgi:UDP-glucuronate 4-epimerase
MRVLVTGSAGFLGSRVCELLLQGGHSVCGFDLLDEFEDLEARRARLQSVERQPRYLFVRGSVCEPGPVRETLERFRPDALVHLASQRDLFLAERDPAACLRLHAGGAAVVLEACRALDVPHVVLGSSAHVYGGTRRFPMRVEDACDRPLSALGASFRAMELLAHAASLRSPVNLTVLRLFSVYGPWQARPRLLPVLAEAAERRAPMPVRGDGTAGRDFRYVDDAALGILRALDRPAPWRILNLGSGESTTLGQVAEAVAWLAAVELHLDPRPLRPGEMPNTFAEIGATREALGFAPVVGLQDGLRRFWEWFRARPDGFRL